MRTEKKLASTTGMVGPGGATGVNPLVIAKSGVGVTAPGDTNENTLATITIPANSLGRNGIVRIALVFTYTSNANNKTFRIRYSGGAGTVVTSIVGTTNTAPLYIYSDITNQNATNSQRTFTWYTVSSAIAPNAAVSSAIDTTAATTVVVTATKATAGDTVTLERYSVDLVYGA